MTRRISQLVSLVALASLLLASCNRNDGPDFATSSEQLVKFVDDALSAGLMGASPPPKSPVTREICVNSELVPTGQVQASYRYLFPINRLGASPDGTRFVRAAESVWKKRGIAIQRDNSEGIIESFGTGRGYNLHVFVNFNTNMVLVAGNGPCTKGPPKPSPDLEGS